MPSKYKSVLLFIILGNCEVIMKFLSHRYELSGNSIKAIHSLANIKSIILI